ncbi:hypothetical protein B0H11DRAFT_2277960, partial [Mycena galericulata]
MTHSWAYATASVTPNCLLGVPEGQATCVLMTQFLSSLLCLSVPSLHTFNSTQNVDALRSKSSKLSGCFPISME